MEIEGLKRIVADLLFDRGAILDKRHSLSGRPVQYGEWPDGKGFRLKLHEKSPDAPLSPFYINLRTPDNPKPGSLTNDDIFLIGQLLFRIALGHRLYYDFVASIPHAGDPIAEAFSKSAEVARRRIVPVLRLIKEESGASRRISRVQSDIVTASGMHVILVDDLCTMVDTKLEAIRVLESAGLIVTDVVVLIDREQGGAKGLLNAGYRLHAVFTVSDLFSYYHRLGVVSQELYDEIVEYLYVNK